MTSDTRRLGMVLAAAALASGCSYVRGSRRLDMTPFAENTIASLGEMARLNKPVVWVQLRKYRSFPSVVETRRNFEPLRDLMRGIAFYSSQIVSLNDADLPDDKKAARLARYLRDVVRPAAEDADAEEWGITVADLDRIIADMKQKPTFLEAIAAADPLVNAALQYGLRIFDRIDLDIVRATADVERELEVEYAAMNANLASIHDVQQRTLRGFALLYRYRLGDADVLEDLRSAVPAAREALAAARPSAKALAEVEASLVAQLARVQEARSQLDVDFATYKESQRELDLLRASSMELARVGRVTLMLWARSHRNLGRGVAVPPVIDVKGILMQSAKNAAGAIL